MKTITTILLILTSQITYSQAITYGYDNAGNQTNRMAYSSSSSEVADNEELAIEQLLALVEQTATIESSVTNHNDEKKTNPSSQDLATNNIKISVYPNPATDVVYLNKEDFGIQKESLAIVYLINSQGKILERIRTTDGRTAIDVRNLAAGIYYVRYISDGENLAWRVVKL